jgi:putative chitinase
MITVEQVIQAVPDVKKLRVALFLPHLVAAMDEFKINTPLRQAAFLAQVFHESGNLNAVDENLNYSAEALQRTWPKRFTPEVAAEYARKPERIANKVYADRMGNRDEASGDGWKYRGAGLIQLTGKNNQFSAAMALDVDPTAIAEYLKTPEGACRSAGWFWGQCGANAYADKGDIDGVSDVVNIGRKTAAYGDSIGFAHRKKLYDAFKKILGV